VHQKKARTGFVRAFFCVANWFLSGAALRGFDFGTEQLQESF
jgi:hypothetical protein